MQNLFNPNINIISRPPDNMSEIKNQFNREPSDVLVVQPRVYKIGDNVGATFRFDLKDQNGTNTSKQWSFWTTPVEVAFEDMRGNHHPSCKNYACEGPITDSKRKLSFNMGYLTDGMAAALDRDHGAGTADGLLEMQKEMHKTLEKQLEYALSEIHRQSLDKSVMDSMKKEGVTEGVVMTMQKEMKKKHNRDKNVFMSTTKGMSWEPNDAGIVCVYNNWVRTFAGTRNEKTPAYPHILDKSGDLTTDVTPDGSAYTYNADDGSWSYDSQKDPHVIKRGQLIKLQLTPCFYATPAGARGWRFKIQRIKLLKQSPYGEKRTADEDWGDQEADDLNSFAKRARTD